jgi:hypothetical protein
LTVVVFSLSFLHIFLPNKTFLFSTIRYVPKVHRQIEAEKLNKELFSSENVTKDHAVEIVRYAGVEVHNISAIIGGVAAQEVVKLITRQYVPFNNTYFYNGITCIGSRFEA